jgi:transglutaminase superfamily protein
VRQGTRRRVNGEESSVDRDDATGPTVRLSGAATGQPERPAAASTVERLRRVPPSYRRFTESEWTAKVVHRLPPDLLAELLDLGLPHEQRDGERRYDRNDLLNVALRHRLASPQWRGLQNLARSYCQVDDVGPVRRTLDISATCPQPGHPGSCELRPAPGIIRGPGVLECVTIAPGRLRIELELPTGVPGRRVYRPAELAVLERIADVEFHHLPGALTADLGFLRDTRLADCRLANRYLLTECRAAGVAARLAFGLLVSRPFSTAHCWIEFADHDDGRWTCGDTFFVTALARWGLLDGVDAPAPPPRGPYWPIGDRTEALMTHRGEPVPWSILTR